MKNIKVEMEKAVNEIDVLNKLIDEYKSLSEKHPENEEYCEEMLESVENFKAKKTKLIAELHNIVDGL